jgi:hypothetical protein
MQDEEAAQRGDEATSFGRVAGLVAVAAFEGEPLSPGLMLRRRVQPLAVQPA